MKERFRKILRTIKRHPVFCCLLGIIMLRSIYQMFDNRKMRDEISSMHTQMVRLNNTLIDLRNQVSRESDNIINQVSSKMKQSVSEMESYQVNCLDVMPGENKVLYELVVKLRVSEHDAEYMLNIQNMEDDSIQYEMLQGTELEKSVQVWMTNEASYLVQIIKKKDDGVMQLNTEEIVLCPSNEIADMISYDKQSSCTTDQGEVYNQITLQNRFYGHDESKISKAEAMIYYQGTLCFTIPMQEIFEGDEIENFVGSSGQSSSVTVRESSHSGTEQSTVEENNSGNIEKRKFKYQIHKKELVPYCDVIDERKIDLSHFVWKIRITYQDGEQFILEDELSL